jgi:hypothetical protein
MKKLITIALITTVITAQAQEQCFSCMGLWSPKGGATKDNVVSGLCLDKKSHALTFTTNGGNLKKWQFVERREDLDGVTFRWHRPADKDDSTSANHIIELADVTLTYKYTVNDQQSNRLISLVSQCNQVTRIGR